MVSSYLFLNFFLNHAVYFMLQVEEMGRENAELRTASQHNSLTVTETEPVSDMKQRPVSMYETRESVRAQVSTGRVV